MEKSKKNVLAWILGAIILSTVSICGTLAYLTSEDSVVNTFTVGQVDITLDETAVTPNGQPIDGAERVKENVYHLIPGRTYVKDPTLTVIKGSEESYVRILVTMNEITALTTILGDDFQPHHYVSGWNSEVWECVKVGEVVNDTITYEFRYFEPVGASGMTEDVVLDALFESISIPGEINGTELATISDLEITIVGHAIQKAGFDTEEAAWEAFENQAQLLK
ncbi:SipW-dependent-type signal peptide-containing protein [Turicibacter sanguinis]|uniref:SipW-dependent-type signal peptide-containing protein n=1 Tax=Turicibacter sanguinis TaxID=154288 RepID=UPI0018AC6A6D|nr:SipW-dependent-type signal peptide-containing protein [Turicibacter sanguinis]